VNYLAKINTILITNHVLAVIGVITALLQDQYDWLMISLVIWQIMVLVGVTVNHRLLAHRSFETSKLWEYVLSTLAVFNTYGSSITWCSIHRMHHANSDRPGDPHSPYINREAAETRKFSWRQSMKIWFGQFDIPASTTKLMSYSADLLRDRYHVWIHKNYFLILLIPLIILAIINPWFVVFGYCLPQVLHHHAANSVVVLTHRWGYRNHDTKDQSTNNWISSVFTMGEGWHNNHHNNPRRWSNQERWWEIDLASWFIRLIKRR
jgi:fatty-acid desaturase